MNATEWLENTEQYYLTVSDVLKLPFDEEIMLTRIRPSIDLFSSNTCTDTLLSEGTHIKPCVFFKKIKFVKKSGISGLFDSESMSDFDISFTRGEKTVYVRYKGDYIVLASQELPDIITDKPSEQIREPWYFRPYTGPDQVFTAM